MFVDTHCHLDHPALGPRMPEVLTRAAAAGVASFIVPSVAPDGWEKVREAARHPGVLAAYGIHPAHAAAVDAGDLERLENVAGEGIAIGEAGLDYADEMPPREAQRELFRSQVRLAVRLDLPLLLHCRRAFPALLQILREEGRGRVRGVMHAFSGSIEIARECLTLGLYVSFAGPVTYENAVRPVLAARAVPAERIVLETDSPDLTPVPHRGVANEPALLPLIAARVAEVRGVSLAEIAAVTTANARALFRI